MKILRIVLIVSIILFLNHCADIMKVMQKGNIENPDVRITKTSLAGLSFEQIDLIFDIEIENPNSIGINLAGFDYDLLLNNRSFLKGEQNKQLEIKANDSAFIQIPLSLLFENIFKTYENLKTNDKINYSLQTGLSFNLPILGKIRIPVSTSGDIPNLKLPTLSVESIDLKKLTITGAEFELAIGINNPNLWGIIVNSFQYDLTINQSKWVNGTISEKIAIDGKKESSLRIPFALNFLQIGTTMYQELSSSTKLNYQFNGRADLSSSLKMLGPFNLPFNLSGKIDLSK